MSLPLALASEASSVMTSWTPTLECTDPGFHCTYSSRSGSLVRQGNVVIAQFTLTANVTAVGAGGDLGVGGLPYSATDVGGGSIASCTANNLPANASGFAAFASVNNVNVSVLTADPGSVGTAGLNSSHTTVGSMSITGSVTYFTDDPA